MTTPKSRPVDASQPAVRAKTLTLQPLVNRMIRGVLRTPLLCRPVDKRLITVYVVGRKSGRRYAVPVAYTRRDGNLLVGTQFGWARNLRNGEPVDIRIAGKRRSADVRMVTDETGVVEHFGRMARDNHQFAKFNQIRLDSRGNPVPDDLHLAWAAGARGVILTPR
jgi:deazaflavin-dependent oxidoreductase (nitroreductase family)